MSDAVKRHYAREGLAEAILAALERAGKNTERIELDDLAPLDEFHLRGRAASVDLARAAGLGPGQRVLDVGCGIGGPSRRIARDFGCRVTGVDLSAEYCRAATLLAARCGLADRCTYVAANALALPCADASFDVVWSQHAAMNIADKPRLYREMRRVLKPDGQLALYDVLAGPGGPAHLPAPWARSAETSFLVAPQELRDLLEAAGFSIREWHDDSEAARAWFAARAARSGAAEPQALGVQLLLGAEFAVMARNQLRNLAERRIAVIRIVCRKR
jgi:ubiquinone/menaquinone biosynthesis C-methylase UbiE